MTSSDDCEDIVFYVLLWMRRGISVQQFDTYWQDVHGPVCARLPAQRGYLQYHLSAYEGGVFPDIENVRFNVEPEDQCFGLAELVFSSADDRDAWFKASSILMDDEYNIFRKAIGYTTSIGHTKTVLNRLSDSQSQDALLGQRFHVLVRKDDAFPLDDFRSYITDVLMHAIAKRDEVLRLRYHLFDALDYSRPDARGVEHVEANGKDYHAAFEISFANGFDRERFFSYDEFTRALHDGAYMIDMIKPCPERYAVTLVDENGMTTAGQRGFSVSQLVSTLGAFNQLNDDVSRLMLTNELPG